MSSEENKMSDKSDKIDEKYERYMDILPVCVSFYNLSTYSS